jgi:hypothetical protein
MSTAKREDKWFPWIFKDCDERTGYSENRILYQAAFLSSGQSKISRRAIDIVRWDSSEQAATAGKLKRTKRPEASAAQVALLKLAEETRKEHGFRISFTPLEGVLFTFRSRYFSLSVTKKYLALRGGPRCFTPGFTGRALLGIPAWSPSTFAYRTITFYDPPFQTVRLVNGLVTPSHSC